MHLSAPHTPIFALAAGAALAVALAAAQTGALQTVFVTGIALNLFLAAAASRAALRQRQIAAGAAMQERALAASENRYRSLTYLCADWYWETDLQHRFTLLGGSLAEAMLASADRCIGEAIWNIERFQPGSGSWENYRALLESRRPFRDFELALHMEEGLRHLSVSGGPAFDLQGHCIGYRGIGQDISAAVAVRSELHQTNERLSESITALERRNREGALLGEMVEAMQLCTGMTEVRDLLPGYLRRLFPGLPATVFLRAEAGGGMEAFARSTADANDEAIVASTCRAVCSGRAQMDCDGAASAHCASARPGQLCLPLIAQTETSGLLQLRLPLEIDAQERSRVAHLAQRATGQLALSFANVQLRERLAAQAFRDPLTGLYNRRYMEDALGRELLAAAREGAPVGLILFDIDHFKRFNDSHGHEAGDAVLRAIGEVALQHVRGSDIACRFGGEEFLLILPGMTAAGAAARAEALCAAVRGMKLTHRGRALGPVSISAGVALARPDASAAKPIFAEVDAALYRAKRAGRDQVAVARDLKPLKRRRASTSVRVAA